ncbi:MAG TPA: MTH938/NDUFAF3 family protein [Pseudolabrys sp.]|nr:MTH938/NDUFAF3 family protein [Pseudolabrys sp.]
MSALADMPHLPRPAPIDAYGNGGFRFADMSHRGSILCLPDGVWAWPYQAVAALDEAALAAIVERRGAIDFFMLGTGRDPMAMPARLRALLADAGINADAMTTGAAIRTYNIMLGENRRVAAGLIAVP